MNTVYLKLPDPHYCSTCYWWEHRMYAPGQCLYYNNSRDWNTDASRCAHWVTIDSLHARGD